MLKFWSFLLSVVMVMSLLTATIEARERDRCLDVCETFDRGNFIYFTCIFILKMTLIGFFREGTVPSLGICKLELGHYREKICPNLRKSRISSLNRGGSER